MAIASERFQTVDIDLQMPVYAATNLVMGGLTAAQMRLALVLVCRSWPSSRVEIEKPKLEQMSGVKLNSSNRLLAPLLDARIDMPGDDDMDGSPVFRSIDYLPGKKGETVGVVKASLTDAMVRMMGRNVSSMVPLPCDEMRRYRSVSSIILRMKLGAEFAEAKTAKVVRMRIEAADMSYFFGSYGRVANIKRTSTVTGEEVETVAMSRAGAVLFEPAVEEITEICDTMSLKAVKRMDGRKWSSIVIEAKRLTPRKFGNATNSKPVKPLMVFRPGVHPDFRNA